MIAGSPMLDALTRWVWGTEPPGLTPEQRLEYATLGGVRFYMVMLLITLFAFTPVTLALRPDLAHLNGPIRLTVALFVVLLLWVTHPKRPQLDPSSVALVAVPLGSFVPLTEVAFDGGVNHPFALAPAFFYLALGMFVPMPAVRYLALGWVMALLPWPFWLTDTLMADDRFRGLYTMMMLAIAGGGALACRQRRGGLWDLFLAEMAVTEKAKAFEGAMHKLEDAQGQLVVLQRKATVGRVTGRIAEGIAEPLGTARQRVDAARDLVDNGTVEGVSEALEEAAFAIQRTSRYVEGLAGGARQLEAGRVVPFDVCNEIEVVVGSLGFRLVDADVSIKVRGGMGLFVTGEAAKFSAAMRNLITNAIEGSEAAGTQEPIEICLALVESGVEVRVIDHGVGIPPEIAGELFQPMVTTRPGRGAGLGLSNTHDVIVGDFGGSIRYESTKGGGATFIFVLPPEPVTLPPEAALSLPPMALASLPPGLLPDG
ncbi:MAG: hypothetical protein KC912_15210 [Proteobacteria bacterium]|nr:hypothetical protein [Pseudomonadota bacterium]